MPSTTKTKKKPAAHYNLDRTGKTTANKKAGKKAAKPVKDPRPPFNPLNLKYKKPGDPERIVPAPGRQVAVGVSRVILDHVYWLGIAVKENNKKAAQTEVDWLARFSTAYVGFASNPAEKPVKYSTTDDYPHNLPKNKKRAGDADDSEESDDSESVDLDN